MIQRLAGKVSCYAANILYFATLLPPGLLRHTAKLCRGERVLQDPAKILVKPYTLHIAFLQNHARIICTYVSK
jgi:hypothetical protein